MIVAVIVGLFVVGGLFYVAAPLRNGPRPDARVDELYAEAVARKNNALDALVEIEEERTIGKLSPDDFSALKHEYEVEAAGALHELDALGRSDADLEAEIAQMRERLACPNCGALRSPGEPCPHCRS